MQGPVVVRPGCRVRYEGTIYTVAGMSGTLVRLSDEFGGTAAMHLPTLVSAPGFEVIGSLAPRRLPAGLLDGLPKPAADKALWWHRHMTELLTGLPPDAPSGAQPRPEYDPATTTLTEREAVKASELSVSPDTIRWRRRRYQRNGVLGMVDGRLAPRKPATGQVDPRVAETLRTLMRQAASDSTHTAGYFYVRLGAVLREQYGPGVVKLPSRATFYRLFAKLEAGGHTTGSARTRRSLANRPEGVFEQVTVARPGELMEIDSTPFDVMVRLDDGVAGRAEMTGLIDLATRSITAVVLRPSTKSVDAALLLARTITPAPMRPGWPDALRMEYSALPYRRLLAIDDRLRHAAAVPVIIPETVVIDGGAAFVSDNFSAACDFLGVEIIHAPPRTPTQKPHIERTLESAASLFAQYVAGYTGRSAEYRGTDVEAGPLWTLPQLQSLLEEWVSAWQNRPHDGLRDPLAPSKAFTPNEKYAALVETAGYLPLPLSAEDYLELLPTRWQAVNSYGIKISHRIYDCDELNPLRRQKSGINQHKDRWEIRYDPYDIRLVWLRNHHHDAWITVPWRLLSRTATPFGELAWDHAARDLRESGGEVTEDRIAAAVDDLLTRARNPPAGPQPKAAPATKRSKREARVAARTKATAESSWPRPEPPKTTQSRPAATGGQAVHDEDENEEIAEVVPLRIFDAREEAKRKWW